MAASQSLTTSAGLLAVDNFFGKMPKAAAGTELPHESTAHATGGAFGAVGMAGIGATAKVGYAKVAPLTISPANDQLN